MRQIVSLQQKYYTRYNQLPMT